jgi:alkanesulfonate monooxygenase SsuD/methylene tetrahydromethanopterin reductase-like flavin-dependent oxidoreductase (luciferase family)
MDFGLLYELQVMRPWDDHSESRAYWESVEQAVRAERAGFSHVWAVEHHFREEFSHMGAPEIWLSAVAQRTTSIRVGHGITLLPIPFNHPIRVAERVGALDILSNGRVEFGTGRSVVELELEGFGISPEDSRPMWEESISFLQMVWSAGDQAVEHRGKYFSMPARKIFPKPVQKPHPPLWVAATSPASYAVAGENGLGVLAFGMAIDKDAMGRRLSEWRAALEANAARHAAVNRNAAVFMMCFCAPTDEEAREICEESFVSYLDHTIDTFIRWGDKKELPPGYEWYARAAQSAKKQSGREKFDYLLDKGMILVGSPERLTKTIQGFQDAGATQMLMAMQLGTIPHEAVLSSIDLFGREVIPNFISS